MHDLNLVTLALNLVKLAQMRRLTFNAFCTILGVAYTAQKTKFSIKDFFSKCDQICRKMRIWSHLLEKSVIENLFLRSDSSMLRRTPTEKLKNRRLMFRFCFSTFRSLIFPFKFHSCYIFFN